MRPSVAMLDPSTTACPLGMEASQPCRYAAPVIRAVLFDFGGVILSEIDLAAATEAHRHHSGMVVTVSMDKIDFKAPVHIGDLVSVFTETCRIGRTSMTIKASVWAKYRFGGGEQRQVTEAQVTMVAVDAEMKPVPVGTGL